ncbi:ketoacyl-ACP synthase III family protein [Kitasatospora sp. NPDC097605]|uniref:ketoacyl-ACP synthase III family protein n=1 Tax=Kitasatospora sp. NPDC097605 TaxID=3157226 RepID=UPI00332FA514
MRYEDVYVAATGSALPPEVPVEEALAAGLVDRRTAVSTGVRAVTVAGPGDSPPELAARAAADALARSGHTPAEVQLLLHATVWYQGHDLWPPASYVQRVAIGNQCPAVEVRQMSNGGMAALELAAAFLGSPAGQHGAAAVLTAADRFAGQHFDRWRSDPGTVYGDGGSALVLSRRGGFARLRSLVTVSDPELEGMHRGDDPFGTGLGGLRSPIDLDPLKRQFLATAGKSFVLARTMAGQDTALKQALAEADAGLDDITTLVLPHFGRRRLQAVFLERLGIDIARTTWEFGSGVGHLGAADQFAGLDHLAATGRLRPGDRCLVMGVGAGFTWSCAVLEIEHRPAWLD